MNRLWGIGVLVLLAGLASGCLGGRAQAVRSPLQDDVFEVQSKLYVVGGRERTSRPWFIAPPDWGLELGTNIRMLHYIIDEYEGRDNAQAQYTGWKIYGTLERGDRIRVAKSEWVQNGSAFSGYLTKAQVLTGPYAGLHLDLYGLILSQRTGKPVENWNPYEDPAPSPQDWKLHPRYLQKVGSGQTVQAPAEAAQGK